MNKRLLIVYVFIAGTIMGLIFFVHYHPTSSFDIYVTQEIQELKTGNFTSVMKFISIFYNPVVMPLSVILVSLFFFVTHNRREFFFIFTTLIPDLLNILVKIMINRPRPTLENAKLFLNFNQTSFPSGHVVHYVVFFGFLLAVMFVKKKDPFVLENCYWYFFCLLNFHHFDLSDLSWRPLGHGCDRGIFIRFYTWESSLNFI